MIRFEITSAARDLVASLDADTVLSGPDRDPQDVDIDPIFAKSFEEVLVDMYAHLDLPSDRPALNNAVGSRFRAEIAKMIARGETVYDLDDRVRVVTLVGEDGFEVAYGAVVDNCDDLPILRGVLEGPTLAVCDEYQGHGLGRALVAVQLLRNEGLMNWQLDDAAYSEGGAACVQAGLRLAQSILERTLEPDAASEPSL